MLYLLSSYPKSGNTWMRVLLSNYFSQSEEAVPINDLMGTPILSSRARFDEEMGVDSSNMTDEEVDNWRPEFCRAISAEISDPTFVKIHDACTANAYGEPIFPHDAVSGVLYIVRNPLQICVSYAHHENKDADWAIDRMENASAAVYAQGKFYLQFRQQLLSWSEHVRSWTEQTALPVHIIKYEDLLQDAERELANALGFLNWPNDPQRLKFAVEMSHISQLQKQESKSGFREKNPESKSFFRSGSKDDWQSELTDAQIQRIVNSHGSMMQFLGYALPQD